MSLQQYIYEKRNGKRSKKGVLFGNLNESGKLCIGFSSCSPRDEFDKEFGIYVAVDRAYKYCDRIPKKVPFSISNNLPKFIDRCRRYFKPKEYADWVTYFISERKEVENKNLIECT